MKKSLLIGSSVVLMATSLVFSGCTSADGNQKVEVVKKPLVKVATAKKLPVEQQIEFTGTIQPFIQNNISPSMAMRIDKIHVDVGDKVRKGQLLVEMDKSQYLQASVQLANLEADLLRYRTLYAEGGISKQQLDQMETQVSVSKHSVANLKENTDLVSPVDGIVTERVYDPGDVYATSQGRILTVMQMGKVKVQINVSESYFPLVKLGMPVDIKLDVYPNESFAGKVSLIHPAIDASTRTFVAEITIPNGNTKLRPGMFSRVALNFGKIDRVLIPDVAVQKQIGTNERFVFTVENGEVNRKLVTTGRIVDKEYEIISGVNEGEAVVIAGAQKLLDKTAVEISK